MSRRRRETRRVEPLPPPSEPEPQPETPAEPVDTTDSGALPEGPDAEPSKEEQAWEAFREEYYESVEQLPLSLHRSFTLMRELDDQAQAYSSELLPSIRAYMELRKSLLEPNPEPSKTSTRTTLSRIAWLSTEIVRTSEEKVALATAAYDSVDRHVRALDAVIKEQETSIALGLRPGTRPASLIAPGGLESASNISPTVTGQETEVTIGISGGSGGPTPKPKGRKKDRLRERKLEKQRRAQEEQDRLNNMNAGEPSPQDAPPAPFDMPIDPHEPRYCFCNQVSFGEMICCDNDDCAREWFHLSCVNLQAAPKGKWMCPECQALLPKRRR